MSVITSYEAAFTSLQTGEPYNIETELINSGAALIVPDSESTDSNGDKYHILKLNFDKLNHEKWQKELEWIKKQGVQTLEDPYEKINPDGTVALSAVVQYLRQKPEPQVPAGRKFGNYGYNEKGELYICTRNMNFDSDSIQTTIFPKEVQEQLIKETVEHIHRYSPLHSDSFSTCYRRDYYGFELEELSHENVLVYHNGSLIRWWRNYCYDFIEPGVFISSAISETMAHIETYTEGHFSGRYYFLNGQECTPAGKSFIYAVDFSNKLITNNEKNEKQKKVIAYLGTEKRKVCFYVPKDIVFPGHYENTSEIFFSDNITCYDIANRTKFEIPPKEFAKKKQEAYESYKNGQKETA